MRPHVSEHAMAHKGKRDFFDLTRAAPFSIAKTNLSRKVDEAERDVAVPDK